MIKVNELRIGNYLWTNSMNHEFKVDIDTLVRLNKGTEYLLCNPTKPICEPILLTEEWLLKFGFAKRQNPNGTICYKTKENSLFRVYLGKNIEHSLHLDVDKGYCPIIQEFLYVHQLQNLYFALTGEELTIKA